MAEALSQSQIDELLKKMQQGNAEPKKEEPVEEPVSPAPADSGFPASAGGMPGYGGYPGVRSGYQTFGPGNLPSSYKEIAVGGGRVPPPDPAYAKARKYDFSSPKKFTRDHLKSLSTLYENFARVLVGYFSSILRNSCELEVLQVEEVQYFEYNNALPDNILAGLMSISCENINYKDQTMLVEIPTNMGFMFVERMMGSTGGSDSPDRIFTEIETSILRTVLSHISEYVQDAWKNFFALNTSFRSIETNGRLLRAFPQQDIVVIITLEFKEGDFEGLINVCMSAENLDDLVDSFSVRYSHSIKDSDSAIEEQKQEIIMTGLEETPLNLEVELDRCAISYADLIQLQPGDVVTLNKRIDANLDVFVHGNPWFEGRLGKQDDMVAVKVVELLPARMEFEKE